MEKKLEELSPSRQVAVKTVYETFKILKENDGQLPSKQIYEKIRERVTFTDWELSISPKTGKIKWETVFAFSSIDCKKAGFLYMKSGVWYLTAEGENAFSLGPVALIEKAASEYRKWYAGNKKETPEDEQSQEEESQIQKIDLERLESTAKEEIREFISAKNPYEFQDLVAALLRGMGYYTPFVAPRGPDGGVDIVAFQDPLGTKTPRIKVQVKHRPEANIPVSEIKNLAGSLNKDGEVGLFVTSGAFTSEAERYARTSHTHIKLIDFNNLIELWQEFYGKLSDDDKNILPLQPIYFLGTNE